ncbi:hypothetical protein BDQ17DRAFT_1323709 [Cyathus striatus]|nr:hypothetical protein BDQ17DRAFT_1323709 [Cyathus striatus]
MTQNLQSSLHRDSPFALSSPYSNPLSKRRCRIERALLHNTSILVIAVSSPRIPAALVIHTTTVDNASSKSYFAWGGVECLDPRVVRIRSQYATSSGVVWVLVDAGHGVFIGRPVPVLVPMDRVALLVLVAFKSMQWQIQLHTRQTKKPLPKPVEELANDPALTWLQQPVAELRTS